MKKPIIYMAALTAMAAASCTALEEKTQIEESQYYAESTVTAMVENGVLSFGSISEFGTTVEALRSNDAYEINVIPAPKQMTGRSHL